MKNRKQKKSGFTLVELMVVAIIVAILAAVAIPMMTGNKGKAMATEAKTACGTIATQIRLFYVENGTNTPPTMATLDIGATALNGTYYQQKNYSLGTITGPQDFVIYAAKNGDAPAVTMTVAAGATTWSGAPAADE